MSRFAPALACVALLAAIAVAGPNADNSKKSAAAAKSSSAAAHCDQCPDAAARRAAAAADCKDCPDAGSKCAECPDAGSKCAECPDAVAECPAAASKAKSGVKLTSIKCEDGTKQVNVARLTAQKKYADYKGKRYYFGCANCRVEFKKNPAKYAASHTGFPIPKIAKKTSAK